MISQRPCSNVADTLLLHLLPTEPTAWPTLCCLKANSLHQHFHFSTWTKQKGERPGDPACIDQSGWGCVGGDRSCLLKRILSIPVCRLCIGTNELYPGLILIPFDLTHFIDSHCAPNEMLNLSPAAAVACGYCYGNSGGEIPQLARCSIKKKAPSIPCLFLIALPLSSPHLCGSSSKLKVTR